MDEEKKEQINAIVESDLLKLRSGATLSQKQNILQTVLDACDEALKYDKVIDAYVVSRQKIDEEFKKNKKYAIDAAQALSKITESQKVIIGNDVVESLLCEVVNKYVSREHRNNPELGVYISREKALSIIDDLIGLLQNIRGEHEPIFLTQQGCINYGFKSQEELDDFSWVLRTGRGRNNDYQHISLAFNLRLIIEKWLDESCENFAAQGGEQLSDNPFKGNEIINKIIPTVIGRLNPNNVDENDGVYRGSEHYHDMFYRLKKDFPSASFTPYISSSAIV